MLASILACLLNLYVHCCCRESTFWSELAADARAFSKMATKYFYSSQWDRYTAALKSMATNPRFRATAFFIGESDGSIQQAAEWCLSVDEWRDVLFDHPKMASDYTRASTIPGLSIHSSNFTDGMVLKTMHPALKLVLGKKYM